MGKVANFKKRTKELKEFVSDGCTLAPDFEFFKCCEEHDMHYHLKDISKWEADKKLRK